MPVVTRWYIRAGLLYLVLALLAGALVVAPAAIATLPVVPGLLPVYFHLLMVGWVTHLIIGVAYWMFPRHSRERPRGRDSLFFAAFGLLNTGLMLRAIGEPLQAAGITTGGPLLVASALLQLAGGWAAVAALWPRVRER
ncbi:MAG: hypothetical protein IT326_01200 [Anaerolineae bacterium]|nr:hypothetical protein [Anaerolineae bacterium]